MEQWLNNEWVSTEETYVRGVGLYQSGEFVLVSVEPYRPRLKRKKVVQWSGIGFWWLYGCDA